MAIQKKSDEYDLKRARKQRAGPNLSQSIAKLLEEGVTQSDISKASGIDKGIIANLGYTGPHARIVRATRIAVERFNEELAAGKHRFKRSPARAETYKAKKAQRRRDGQAEAKRIRESEPDNSSQPPKAPKAKPVRKEPPANTPQDEKHWTTELGTVISVGVGEIPDRAAVMINMEVEDDPTGGFVLDLPLGAARTLQVGGDVLVAIRAASKDDVIKLRKHQAKRGKS